MRFPQSLNVRAELTDVYDPLLYTGNYRRIPLGPPAQLSTVGTETTLL